MAFRFRWLCELLNDLDKNRVKKAASSSSRSATLDHRSLVAWFNRYSTRIDRSREATVAFLSCLFPERRPDRVYNLQRKRLASIFGRGLGLGATRLKHLNSWQDKDGADFPDCVEAVMAQTEFPEPGPGHEVTLEEINAALDELASRSPFSAPAIRHRPFNPRDTHDILNPILRRLQSWEAKWLVRMLLKSFSPVVVPEQFTLHEFHFLLPDLLNFQDSFEAAAQMLGNAHISQLPTRPSREYERALKLGAVNELIPHVGIMIRRPSYDKARSIKHCCQVATRRQMSVERKYDGEYCQIHIDLTKGRDCIKIFSKSGKDSTTDRIRLHGNLKDCLKLGALDCKIKKYCILEGELLVWSDREMAVQPFHKIRKHVQRSGRWLGSEADSPAAIDEHLMIVFHDLLLLDQVLSLRDTHSRRRHHLESLVLPRPGYAAVGDREKIDFSSHRAPDQLRKAFAEAITQGWEGFVLKGSEDCYSSLEGGNRYIKLKKDYIAELGDTADLAIIGGGRDPKIEKELALGKLSWTMFFLGCLENKEEVCRFAAKPKYRIVDILGHHNISRDDILFLNQQGQFVQIPFGKSTPDLETVFDRKAIPHPTDLFKQVFVVEILGAGFDKPPNVPYFTLRFPRVLKIHSDRSAEETISFDELQKLARQSLEAPLDADSQEDLRWIAKLVKADGRSEYIIDKSQTTTPGKSPGTISTATPRVPSTASASIPSTASPRVTFIAGPNVTPKTGSRLESPILVRSDTPELHRIHIAQGEKRALPESPNTRSVEETMTKASKRKIVSFDATPEANTSSKRVKISSLGHTAPRPQGKRRDLDLQSRTAHSSPCQNSRVYISQDTSLARVGGLKTTPPWCQWSGQDRFPPSPLKRPRHGPQQVYGINDRQTQPARKKPRPAPNSGEPLSEITNGSPKRTRGQSLPAKDRAAERARARGSPELGPASRLRKALKAQNLQAARGRHCLNEPSVLPTPPTSSPTDAKVPGKSSMSASTAPLLLGESLTHLSTHPARPLDGLLRSTSVGFTYSQTYFMHSLFTSLEPHIVLVDTERPDSVATEIGKMGRSLRGQALSSDSSATRKGRVVFLDWSVLRTMVHAEIPHAEAKKAFAGCLAWDCGDQKHLRGNETVKVSAVWNWEEACK